MLLYVILWSKTAEMIYCISHVFSDEQEKHFMC